MPSILDRIVETKYREIAAAKRLVSEVELERRVGGLPPARDIPLAEFERFLGDAPYGRESKSLLLKRRISLKTESSICWASSTMRMGRI